MAPRLQPGATYEIRGEAWTLAREQRFDACRLLTLRGAERSNGSRTLRLIAPFDRPRMVARPKLRRRPRRAVLRAALGAITSARSTTGLWSAAEASIAIWPYQLEPALAIVSGATRLLLADAVGLGKTIQAGLILAELRARGWIERALIVCPSGLRETWAGELRERFRLDATIVDQHALAERMAAWPPGVNPWRTSSIAIVSVDLLKRSEILAAVEQVPIDLLIADEAHHLTPGTERGAAVSQLAERVPWVVLLSATPHSGDAAAFSYLAGIGSHGDPLTVFRRTRADAGAATTRRTHVLPVRPRGAEATMLEAVDRYVRAIWAERGNSDPSAQLVAITIARRAASSTAALLNTATRRLALLSGHAEPELEQGLLPWDESDAADALERDRLLAVSGLEDAARERAALEEIADLARRCGAGAKIERLARLLHRIHEPALVFTEYRDTLDAITAHINHAKSCVIHGGMPADARRDALTRFHDGRADILVATDAAGEGLNLHHRCRLVIDVELPWNPLRLEQRAGRVDRIGQQRTVHAIRLFHHGTIEARVLHHLQLRRGRADAALERCASEHAIAESVFEGREPGGLPAIAQSHASVPAHGEAQRIIQQRAALAHGASASTQCWAPPRHGSLLSVHRTTFTSEAGWPVADHIEARQTRVASRRLTRREWRSVVEHLAHVPASHPASMGCGTMRPVVEERIAAIRQAIATRLRVEYQRSLFDGRADADASARSSIAAGLEAALLRTMRAATSAGVLHARSELIAAWPESQ